MTTVLIYQCSSAPLLSNEKTGVCGQIAAGERFSGMLIKHNSMQANGALTPLVDPPDLDLV